MRALVFAVLLCGCGQSVCDDAATRFCQRALTCRLIDSTSSCIADNKRRFSQGGATDAQCKAEADRYVAMGCCTFAHAIGGEFAYCPVLGTPGT